MSYTALQDSTIRKNHYINALNFYLTKTDFKICMIENTNYDISSLFFYYIKNKRLEYITFSGNNYDKSLGKGYGEAEIIKFALQNSRILNQSTYVIKITGRLIVNNINSIGNNIMYRLIPNILRFDFMNKISIQSMCFVCPTMWLNNNIDSFLSDINDSKGVYFEHALFNSIIKSKGYILLPFYTPPQICGISGTSNKPYKVLSKRENLQNNIKHLNSIYASKKGLFNYFISKILYTIFIIIGNNWNKIIKNKLK